MGPKKKSKAKTMVEADKPREIKPRELEAPFNWIRELPGLGVNCKELLSMEGWLLRHCSARKDKTTMRVQPLKRIIRGCIQAYIDCQGGFFGVAKKHVNWLRRVVAESSGQLEEKKIDPQGIDYIFNGMDWFIITSQRASNPDKKWKYAAITQDFNQLSKSAQVTVYSAKLVFYGVAHFPLHIQRRLAQALVQEEECYQNFEAMHQYVRILRKCRHQKQKETLGFSHVIPSQEELSGINQALTLDNSNYKIKTTACELLFDFVKTKVNVSWKPFKIGKHLFSTSEDIVRFLDAKIRELLILNSWSVRLNNLAMKLNISRSYRELFHDEESRRFGFNKVDVSIGLNPKSSSANYLIGMREIHHGKCDEAVNYFKQAMSTKPLSPKYTLAYIRALVASFDNKELVNEELEIVPQIKNIIEENIRFGREYKWSDWNIHHLQFLNGLLTWIAVGHNVAFKEWLSYYSDSSVFQKQFKYLSPFGLTRLMLQARGSAISRDALLQYCQEQKTPETTVEKDFINSLKQVLCPSAGKLNEGIINNEFYLKKLRPVHKIIKIDEKAETFLPSYDWARLQEKKLMAEMDQGKLIENQIWYKKKIMAHNKLTSDERPVRTKAISFKTIKVKTEKKMKIKRTRQLKKKVDEGMNEGLGAIVVKFGKTCTRSKNQSKKLFPYDFTVC